MASSIYLLGILLLVFFLLDMKFQDDKSSLHRMKLHNNRKDVMFRTKSNITDRLEHLYYCDFGGTIYNKCRGTQSKDLLHQFRRLGSTYRKFCLFMAIVLTSLNTTVVIAFPHNATDLLLKEETYVDYCNLCHTAKSWKLDQNVSFTDHSQKDDKMNRDESSTFKLYSPTEHDNLTLWLERKQSVGKNPLSYLWNFQYSHIPNKEFLIYPFFAFLANRTENSITLDEEMAFEVRRLQSFNKSPVIASPVLLAQSGFYATGHDDETCCFSCKFTYRNWQMMDKPDIVHRNISPECPHLNGRDARNVPIHSEHDNRADVNGLVETYPQATTSHASIRVTESREDAVEEEAGAAASSTSGDGQNSEDISTNLDISQAVYPQYRDQQSRLDSYQGWGCSLVQDPNVLAGAGFYYAGYRDCVRCFYCGVGLRTWEREDDPWVEHVRWRSSCDYCRCMKGEQCIIEALTKGNQSGPVLPPAAGPTHTQKMSGVSKTNEVVNDIQLETLTEKLLLSHEEPAAKHATGYQRTPSGICSQLPKEPAPQTVLYTRFENPPQDSAKLPQGPRERTEGHSLGSESLVHGDVSSKIPTTIIQQTKFLNSVHNGGKNDNNEKLNDQENIWPNNTAPESPSPPSHSLQRQLEEENQSLRDESTCKVCLDNPSCIVFLPCGHLVTCAECAPALRKCPVCRALIRGTVRAYMD